MAEEKKIKTSLYGGIGNVPLRAESIFCDCCGECQLYKKGHCLRVTAPFAPSFCKYGCTRSKRGYTRRSVKYYQFETEVKADEAYGAKLTRPSSVNIAKIGDYVFVGTSFFNISEIDKDKAERSHGWGDRIIQGASGSLYRFAQSIFSSGDGFVRKEDIEDVSENGILHAIFSSTPRTFFENAPIKDYKVKTLPDFAMALKRNMPELAERFFRRWPEFDCAPNYVGKSVYISTLPQGIVIKDKCGMSYRLEGDELICDDYQSYLFPFGARKAKIRIQLSGEETYEVKDNSEVGPDTRVAGVD